MRDSAMVQTESISLYEPSAIQARSSVYRLLASFFARELTAESLLGWQQGEPRKLLDALAQVEDYATAMTWLRAHISELSDPEQAALDMAESYAWLFHGVGGSHAVSPYASVYLNESRATHQEVERELGYLIREQGLSFDNSQREPYDHLAVILEFVAWLDEAEQQRDRMLQIRQHVIDTYLVSWLPAFTSRALEADRSGFYAGLAAITLALVKQDCSQAG
jgi:TorA specific chaperone